MGLKMGTHQRPDPSARHGTGLSACRAIAKRLQCKGLRCCRALYFLEPMLTEHGLGTSPDERDRLASDEPNVRLPSPT